MRLLARGELSAALTIEIHSASKAAIAAVEKAGGKLILAQPREAEAPSRRRRPRSSKRPAAAQAAGETGAADAEAGPGGDA